MFRSIMLMCLLYSIILSINGPSMYVIPLTALHTTTRQNSTASWLSTRLRSVYVYNSTDIPNYITADKSNRNSNNNNNNNRLVYFVINCVQIAVIEEHIVCTLWVMSQIMHKVFNDIMSVDFVNIVSVFPKHKLRFLGHQVSWVCGWLSEWVIDYVIFLRGLSQQWRLQMKQNLEQW